MVSGDEMFSDTYKMKLVDEVIYEVTGKLVTRSQGDIHIDGFNPSAEEADEGTDSNVESGVDIVLNHRLVETYAFGDKKSYTLYLKDYMKKWVKSAYNTKILLLCVFLVVIKLIILNHLDKSASQFLSWVQ